jgi:hypothetical protein
VFVHPELVVKPGLDQIGAAYLVMVATVGITFSLQATYSETRIVDRMVRIVLAAMSLYILFSFNDIASTAVSVAVLAVIGYWFVVRRKIVAAADPEARTANSALASAAE